jgi:2'-5' RNA ligase
MKRLSIIALPDHSASEVLHLLMNDLSRETGATRALAYPPHFTIWAAFKVEDARLAGMYQRLSRIAAASGPIQFELTGYGFYPWRVVYLDIPKLPQLQQLHDQIMAVVQEFRTSWIPDSLLTNDHMGERQRASTRKYGYQFAGEFYSPHFTLAGNDLTESAFEKLKHRLSQQKFELNVAVEQFVVIDLDERNRITRSFRLD